MKQIPDEFTLKTGRYYDFEQVLYCYLTEQDGEDAVYFIVDPSRGMSYEIRVPLNLHSSDKEIKERVLKSFMNDDYVGSPMNFQQKLTKFGWRNHKEKL
ncbi:hypothetical protein DMW08_30695 [Vibrio parahaemolyticus]|nr:hypothetical protein [Vibrio parahaemolyticus]EGR2988743.1 hypothetical protein [Vibrio parahaemolyticus]